MLEDMRGLLQTADEKKQAAIAELSAKQQKVKMLKDASSIPFSSGHRKRKLMTFNLCFSSKLRVSKPN